MGSEVRSSNQERGSSSSVGVDGAITDTATSVPSSAPSSILPSASVPFITLRKSLP